MDCSYKEIYLLKIKNEQRKLNKVSIYVRLRNKNVCDKKYEVSCISKQKHHNGVGEKEKRRPLQLGLERSLKPKILEAVTRDPGSNHKHNTGLGSLTCRGDVMNRTKQRGGAQQIRDTTSLKTEAPKRPL